MREKAPKTLQEAVKHFADDLTCINFIAHMRWLDGVAICPHCANDKTYFLATRKIYKCKACQKQFSIKTGTIFEDSALGLDKWLMAMWLLVNAKNGISSYELSRSLGITQRSAWFVLHRIRTAMVNGSIEKLSGDVEVDETFIGGLGKNMHLKKRKGVKMMTGGSSKTAVMGIVQRRGRVKAQVIKSTDRETLHTAIEENVEPGSTVMTDAHRGYQQMSEDFKHEVINHTVEYVRDNVHTNNIENFWSLLKRTIKGTYVSVSPEHLQKYVEEQMFRYNEREGSDQQRFVSLVELISGKRLTYAQLIGYETGQ
jgi:transposase-like protein